MNKNNNSHGEAVDKERKFVLLMSLGCVLNAAYCVLEALIEISKISKTLKNVQKERKLQEATALAKEK
ncbi:hypothetical protein TNCT_618271 [Trichonephila clavata]|uniref:Uncharacterized protein n=1 Tax=Trichonephila clavata TaxID=2740835 RepID=A0A8X6JXQ5_TRICU|nr:hypothetical protein TNCT_618271 [Trichonephila clavata]